jgi:hypothetical protein
MIALSSMEAEYMAESLATWQIIWLRSFTAELGIPYSGSTTLNVDNQGVINYSINAINHSRTKHIDIQHHFVGLVMCRLGLEAPGWAKPSQKSPGQAQPEGGLERAFGRACKNRKPEPQA